MDNDLSGQVASLSFSTMLAIVPIMAAVMAVARGFGFSDFLLDEFRQLMRSQPEAAEAIITFADRYLAHNSSYVIVGLGLLLMLYTVMNLFRTIEQAFNAIWQVKSTRELARMAVDYSALTLLFTVSAILCGGLTVFVGGLVDSWITNWALAPVVKAVSPLLQIASLWACMMALYTFMPNARVPLRYAMWPGLLSATLMIGLQYGYYFLQYFLSSYNTVYGSVAILPLFMIWLNAAWYICLSGAQLTYSLQYGLGVKGASWGTAAVCRHDALWAMTFLLGAMGHANRQGKELTMTELAQQLGLPLRLANEWIDKLVEAGMVNTVISKELDDTPRYALSLDVALLKMPALLEKLDREVGLRLEGERWQELSKVMEAQKPMVQSWSEEAEQLTVAELWQTMHKDETQNEK